MIQAIVKWHPSIGDEEIGGEGICFTYDEKNNCFQMKGEISRYRQCPEHPSRFEVKLLDSEHELCEVGHLNGVFVPENRHHDYSSWSEFYRENHMIAPAVKSALVECKDFLNSCYPCAITATVEDIYIHPEYRLRGYATALIAKLKEILGATIMHGPDVILLANAKAYEISGEGTDAKRTDPENAKLAQLRLVRMMESAGYAYNTEFSRIKVYDVHAQLGSGRN